MSRLNLAAYHHLPTGGALRVLAEWLRRTTAEQVTVYTPDASVHAFADVPDNVRVQQVHVPGPFGGIASIAALLRSERAGRRVAETIDAAGHDAVLVLPSRLTQSPSVLRFLQTPHVYYAPEAMRSAFEDPELVFFGDHWTMRVTRAGANPIEHLRRRLDRRAVSRARKVVAHSEFSRQDLKQHYGVDAEVLRLGVDLDRFQPLVADGDGGDGVAGEGGPDSVGADPYVLSVGAFHPLKGHDLVVEALGRLKEPRPRLVIVGDRGGTGPELEAQAARLGVELDARHSVPFDELVELLQHATVTVCAQIREPFGLVPLESMACARPVVAVDEGGLRESVRDGQTGFLVPRDPQAMADALRRLLNDPGLRTRFGQAGRAAVEADWRWDAYAAEMDRVLAEQVRTATGV